MWFGYYFLKISRSTGSRLVGLDLCGAESKYQVAASKTRLLTNMVRLKRLLAVFLFYIYIYI